MGPVAVFSGLVRKFDFMDHMKVDWMFVRGYSQSARKAGPRRMAPHFPEVYEELRNASKNLLSRHAIMTVLLPLREPGSGPQVDTPLPPDSDDYGACYVNPDDPSQCTDS
jgi:hypothetical protein